MCQGSQTSLDSKIKGTDTLLQLTLTAPRSTERESIFPEKNIPTSLGLSSWSFPHTLSNSSSQPRLCKSFSSPRLNDRSLELCTENLGSETGSDTSESSIFESRTERPAREHQRNIKQISSGKKRNPRCFPPPLTSTRSSSSYQVRPHRENGRLIIKVVESPSTGTCFEAHRDHGRLQLTFSKHGMQKLGSEKQEDGIAESDGEVRMGLEKN
ncbi:protein FANTASTIC FOUR 3 [Daucus carota subsp. sativus]